MTGTSYFPSSGGGGRPETGPVDEDRRYGANNRLETPGIRSAELGSRTVRGGTGAGIVGQVGASPDGSAVSVGGVK